MAGDDVLEYVREHLDEFGPEKVEQALVAAGYDPKVVEHAIDIVSSEQPDTTILSPRKRHLIVIGMVVLMVFLFVILSLLPPLGYETSDQVINATADAINDGDAGMLSAVLAPQVMIQQIGLNLDRETAGQRIVQAFNDTDLLVLGPRLKRNYTLSDGLRGETWFVDVQAPPYSGAGFLSTVGKDAQYLSPDLFISMSDHRSVTVIDAVFGSNASGILFANHKVVYEGANEDRRPVSIQDIGSLELFRGGNATINGIRSCETQGIRIQNTCDRRLQQACQDESSQWCQDVRALCDLCREQGTCGQLQDMTVELACELPETEGPHLINYNFVVRDEPHEIRILGTDLLVQ